MTTETLDRNVAVLAERFAKAFSDEYSATVDRKDAILDYITGKTEAMPDMVPNSSYYAYKTVDALEKLGKKDDGDVFYRAGALLMRMTSLHTRKYSWLANPMSICLGDGARVIGLSKGGKLGADRMERLIRRLSRTLYFAGEALVTDEIQSKISNCKFQNKNAHDVHGIVEAMLLLKLYGRLDESHGHQLKFSQQMAALPEMLQSVLKEDAASLKQQLHNLMEPLVLLRIQSKENQSAAELEGDFLRAKRERIVAERYPNSGLNPKNALSSQVFHQTLQLIAGSLLYAVNIAGGKAEFLKNTDETSKALLDAARTLHEVYPLEIRNYLSALDSRSFGQREWLEGILSLDEPYGLIELIRSELNSYSVPWKTLQNAVLERIDRALRAYDIIRSPFLKAYLHKVLGDNGSAIPENAGTLEESVFAALRDPSEGGRYGLGLARYLDGTTPLEDYWKDQNNRNLFDMRNRDKRRSQIIIAATFLPVESPPFRKLAILMTSKDCETLEVVSEMYQSFAFSGEQLLKAHGDDPEMDKSRLLTALLKLNGMRDYSYKAMPHDEYVRLIEQNLDFAIGLYKDLPTDTRMLVLEAAFAARDSLSVKELAAIMAAGLLDSSKKANALSLSEFARVPDKELYKTLYLKEKKASVKELALDGVRSLPDGKAVYGELLDKEKSAEWKSLIQILMDTADLSPVHAHAALADLADAKKLSRLSWLSATDLPSINGTDGQPVDDRIKSYILLQSMDHTTAPNERLNELRAYAGGESLARYALELIQLWLQNGAPAKEKWTLYVGALFGDLGLVHLLVPQIRDWTDNSRGAMAAEAVKALSYINEPAALMAIDAIKRTVKNRQVKGAAEEALVMAAENQGLTPEQLADRLVTSLGFDEKGTQLFSYGERAFRVKVNRELEVIVLNEETGKALKSLPAPGLKDDQELAAKAKARFTQLKKDLKTMVGIQALRLEESLSKQRLWSAAEWKGLFVDNMIMQKFAVALVWGVYENGKLKETFRFMEDGTFNTADEDEYELPQEAGIGLVHPLELEGSLLEGWKSQLEDYEIKQPFPQLDRDVHVAEEDERRNRQFDRLPEEEFSPTAFPKALEKYGWYKGQAMDGGWYTELYKEYGDLIAELRFSGTSIAYYEGMEQITLESLQFFRNKHDRYHYYDNTAGIPLGDVPGRVYSETVYDILRAAGR